MTQFPKPNSQNSANGNRSSAISSQMEERTPTTDSPYDPPNSLSSQNQGAIDAQEIKPLKSELRNQPQETEEVLLQRQQSHWWQKLSLQVKATAMAVAIGVIPVLAVGGIAYFVADQGIRQQISDNAIAEAIDRGDKLALFVNDRYADIQVLAKLDVFTNPKVREKLTRQEKEATLNFYLKDYQFYDSIALLDLKGNVLAQSQGKPLNNRRNQEYFQAVLHTNRPFISDPQVSASSGIFSFYIAVPVKDKATGKMIAILRARIPMDSIKDLFDSYTQEGKDFYLIDSTNVITASGKAEFLGQKLEETFPNLFTEIEKKQAEQSADALLSGQGEEIQATALDSHEGKKNFIAYAFSEKLREKYKYPLNWRMVVSNSAEVAFAPQRQLLWTLLLGTGAATVLVGVLAVIIAQRATRPILAAASAVEKIGRGELDTRLHAQGADEIAMLSSNINDMATQLKTLLEEQTSSLEQLGQAHQQAEELAEERRKQNEALQGDLLQFLNNVEGASEGDLTVRAEITAGEIGIVADFFNAIIESLRDIVTQVKQAANQVNSSVGNNEGAINQLADEATRQATQIANTLNSVEQMTLSIQEVADNARAAAEVARTASTTAETGGAAMERTVESISQLRSTVAETAKKVKRLGESSQQISKVISLINQIALQTNLLAINASIEAARAGEEGRGFAVVAEEVGELAAQSTAATKEIEQIVENIQLETSEVVEAMELGTSQVVEGTRLVEETKQSLGQIVEVSRQIDQLVQSISGATVSQAQTSESVTKLMEEIAQISEKTSDSSRTVSGSLQETVAIAQQLQASVGAFKVGDEK